MGTYLLNGSTGFLGSNLLLELLHAGNRVIACHRGDPLPSLRDEAESAGDVLWVPMDVAHEAAWADLPGETYDAIIHNAAITAPENDTQPKRTAEVNFMSTLYAAEWAIQRKVPRYIFASSSAVYRYTHPTGPMKEDMAIDPRFTYGLSKVASERFLSVYRENLGLDCCSVRLPSMYGPWERPTGSRDNMSQIYHIAEAVASGRALTVTGATVGQDWTYVRDAALGMIHLAEQRGGPEVMNLSIGYFVTLKEILEALDELVPDHRIRLVEDAPFDLEMTGTSGNQPMDPTLLKETGFVADTSIKEGLQAYLDWFKR